VCLGRAIVLDEYGGGASRHEIAREAFMGRKIAEHPAAAIKKPERRKRARHPGWAYDDELDGLPFSADCPFGNVRFWEVDLDARLEIFQCRPRLRRGLCSIGLLPPAARARRKTWIFRWTPLRPAEWLIALGLL
jgi:hypothetical protein